MQEAHELFRAVDKPFDLAKLDTVIFDPHESCSAVKYDSLLFLTEPIRPSRFRSSGQYPVRQDAASNCRHTLYNENRLPGFHKQAIRSSQSVRNEAGSNAAQRTHASVRRNAQSELRPEVPKAQVQRAAGRKRSLEHAEQEAQRDQPGRVRTACLECARRAPSHQASGQPCRRRHDLEHQTADCPEEDGADVESCRGPLVQCGREPEVLLQADFAHVAQIAPALLISRVLSCVFTGKGTCPCRIGDT